MSKPNPSTRKPLKSAFVIFALMLTSEATFAAGREGPVDAPVIEERTESVRFSLVFPVGYSTYSGAAGSISAITFGGGFGYAVSTPLSVGLTIRQGSTSVLGAGAAFTHLAAYLGYVLRGSNALTIKRTMVDGQEVSSLPEEREWSLMATLGINQYWFNATSSSVGYTGLGLGLLADRPLTPRWSMIGSLNYDQLYSGTRSITGIGFSIGLRLWAY